MKKQFLFSAIIALLFAAIITSAMAVKAMNCQAETQPIQKPVQDLFVPGPVNMFQL